MRKFKLCWTLRLLNRCGPVQPNLLAFRLLLHCFKLRLKLLVSLLSVLDPLV